MSPTIKISLGCKFNIENVTSSDKAEDTDCFEQQIMQIDIDCADENPNLRH